MGEQSAAQLYEQALRLIKSGQLEEAKFICERICRQNNLAAAWISLVEIHARLGRFDEALSCARRAINLEPNSANAHLALGKILLQVSRFKEAAEACECACNLNPLMSEAWHVRGLAHLRSGNVPQAERDFRRLIILVSDHVDGHVKLGATLRLQGRLKEARECYQRALDLAPDNAEAVFSRASLDRSEGRLADAAQGYRRAIDLKPDFAEACNNLGNILQIQKYFVEATDCFKRAIAIKPNIAVFHYNLANALTYQNRLNEAISSFRRSLELDPDNAAVRSNLLLILNYDPNQRPDVLYREHLRWGEIHGATSVMPKSYPNAADPNRKLRVGYVSSDFRIHPIGYLIDSGEQTRHSNDRKHAKRLRIGYVSPDFRANHSVSYYIEPLIAGHDRSGYEVYCYSVMPRPDETTRRFQRLADHWRDIHGSTDLQAAEQVVKDEIDILVDLSGHTTNNSLPMFAHKPAPVQVTYLGYPNTTGLPAMDYRLTDAIADPAGAEVFYTEELVRLPGCFLCYQPPAAAPSVVTLPATEAGYITFGSFNNLAKINSRVVELWSRVIEAVPESRLLIKNLSLNDPEVRARYAGLFESSGIDAKRVELCGYVDSLSGHLALYGRVDIALDTFPYNGTTTTCEALWMGVPVITLAGDTHAGRVGESLLKCTGLGDWVADSADKFVSIAREAAGNIPGLAELRAGLRAQVAASRLCDRVGFVRDAEQAYQWMWTCWCDSRQ